MKMQGLNRLIITTSLIGILVSTYALYVEMAAEASPGYTALCDIAEHASCSKVLTSVYAKGLGLLPEESQLKMPNCIYGIFFYCTFIFLTTFDQIMMIRLQAGLVMTSLAVCVYLAYILIFLLRDFCVVCVSTYIVNVTVALLLYKKYHLAISKKK